MFQFFNSNMLKHYLTYWWFRLLTNILGLNGFINDLQLVSTGAVNTRRIWGVDNCEIQIDFSGPGNLKFDRWPQKATRNLFHAPGNFVCHFMAIHEFKLQLLSGYIHIGDKSLIFQPPVHYFLVIGEVKLKSQTEIGNFIALCELKIWLMTLKSNRAHLLCHPMHHLLAIDEFKLELQPGNAQSGSKPSIIWPVWPEDLISDLKIIGHLFYVPSSFVRHFVAIGEFKMKL